MHTPGHPIPLSPAAALKLHIETMSDYERGEILEYSEIYCTGHTSDKIRASMTSSDGNNHGDGPAAKEPVTRRLEAP